MKKYRICLFLFLAVSIVCGGVGLAAGRQYEKNQREAVRPTGEMITETAPEGMEAARVEGVGHETEAPVREEYYLVSEDGFLLVFLKDKKTINLYTHVPLMDFPEKEQEKLREGIWFPSMMEVFQYLESYTS